MKDFEVTGMIDEKGQLLLDEPLDIAHSSSVRVIILVNEENEPDRDDTPLEEIKASLRRALQEAKEGKTYPISQMWEGIDAE